MSCIAFWATDVWILPREGIEAVGFAGVRKGHTQAGHEGRVEDHCGTLVPGRQVHRRHRPYALTVQDDVFWSHSIPSEETREREEIKPLQIIAYHFKRGKNLASAHLCG